MLLLPSSAATSAGYHAPLGVSRHAGRTEHTPGLLPPASCSSSPSRGTIDIVKLGNGQQCLLRDLQRIVHHGLGHREALLGMLVQIARLARTRPCAVRLLGRGPPSSPVDLDRGVVAVAVGRAGLGLEGRLLADFFEDLLQELGEGGHVAGAEQREGAGLDLGWPVVGMSVEGVEEVVLDPGSNGRGQQPCCILAFGVGYNGSLDLD